MSYQGKTVLVVGAARSGVAAAAFLLERRARVILTDTKTEAELGIALEPLRTPSKSTGRLALELGGHKPESFSACDFVVVSPGVPLSLPLFDESRKKGIPIIAEVELAWRHLKGRILGITGSNGKTTTTILTAELLRGAGLRGHAAGNMGVPLISFAAQSTPDEWYSTELSSFQLEGIQEFRPAAGAILNLTPDHLDRYRGFDEYIAAKERLFMNQRPADFAVLNADDERTSALAGRIPSTPVLFSRRSAPPRGLFLRGGRVVSEIPGRERDLFGVEDIRLKGGHNVENVLAACALALLAGAAPESLRHVIREFKGVEHRLEWVAEIDGVQYFNDSKATNVDATVKSLEAFPGKIHLIAGGRDKGGDFTMLRALVRERVRQLVLIGEAAGKIRDALRGCVEMSDAADMRQAVEACRRKARPGDVVLLAPACASFDMFKDFEHRGRTFKAAVSALQRATE
jgi:UDP-N-acetylmuramoylalanine--D-glutamate ligase